MGSPLQDPARSLFPAGWVHNRVSKDCFPPLAPLLLSLPSSSASQPHKGVANFWTKLRALRLAAPGQIPLTSPPSVPGKELREPLG